MARRCVVNFKTKRGKVTFLRRNAKVHAANKTYRKTKKLEDFYV